MINTSSNKRFYGFLLSAALIGSMALTNTTVAEKAKELDLGKFSMSLAVKDIEASLAFYQKLGFKPLPGAGGVEQKWIILINGNTKIGLFQGMFPTNTITFNPKDACTIHDEITSDGIEIVFSMGIDKEKGKCAFTIADPDGNPILIDQHN